MTITEWAEIYEWVADRFPRGGWTSDQGAAYFKDLERFDTSDVWAALFKLYEAGSEFAPAGGTLLAATLEAQRQQAHRDRLSLPEPSTRDSMSWVAYSQKAYGEVIPIGEAIIRAHAAMPPCRFKTCEVHHGSE